MLRVLITGVAGFVGRHLTELCRAQGASVIGIGRRKLSRHAQPPGLDAYIAVDLSEKQQADATIRSAAPDRIFHLAAETSVTSSWADPSSVLHNNFCSTHHLLEAVLHERPDARVLVASSASVYGSVASLKLPITEEHPLCPRDPYAMSKVAVDLLADFYAQAHGLAVVRTRTFNHVGPGQSDAYVISGFARQIAAAEATSSEHRGGTARIVVGNPDMRRDLTDVRDVARAYWTALERPRAGVFNVCSGSSTSLGEVLGKLGRLTGLSVEHRTDAALVREGDVMELRGSPEAFMRATAWQPELPLETTLADTLTWWRMRLASRSSE